jgi:anti-sigma B factor antagonist
MALILEIKNGVGLITPSGSFDATVADAFKTQVTAWWNAHPELELAVVDLGDVTFMASAGLGALICLLKAVATRGGDLRLARPRSTERLLFQITRVNKIFGIYNTVAEAMIPVPADD